MRTLLKVQIPTEAGNAAIKSGSLPKIMAEAMQALKPEAAYFLTEEGLRTALMVFDLADPSRIPWVAERFFLGLDAEITFTPVMNGEDLQKGLKLLEGEKF